MTDQQQPLGSGEDVLLRVMEFLGPRYACLGLGATCRELHRLSRQDALWRVFWAERCLLRSSGELDERGSDGIHGAAMVFRHAIHEMNLGDRLQNISRRRKGITAQPPQQPACDDGSGSESDDDKTALYAAYVQKHTAMKLTNLRVEPHGRRLNDEELEQSYLRGPLCTQTWPGSLSLVVDEAFAQTGHNRRTVTCLNPAEVWCDHPSCKKARCGPRGCLRTYRFAPRNYGPSASLVQARQYSESDYDVVSFVKCSWCTVSFCNEHVRPDTRSWYSCDECNLSSCPDCVSQVFLSPPDSGGCRVETAGRKCRTKVCKNCIWYVGRKRQNFARNIPGGDYSQARDSTIVTVRGEGAMEADGQEEWEEVEKSCSKCLRHVEFRWREMAQVQESFGGFMP